MNNYQLSKYFTFYELTKTNNSALLDQNRHDAVAYLPTGKIFAKRFLDHIRGDKPLYVNSGFRGDSLNSITQGASLKSQHRLFQAADVCRPAEKCEDVFSEILDRIMEKKIPFGQLIYEEVERDYGVARWIHISLGPGFRPVERCGQVLTRFGDVWNTEKLVDCKEWVLPEAL